MVKLLDYLIFLFISLRFLFMNLVFGWFGFFQFFFLPLAKLKIIAVFVRDNCSLVA